MAGVRFEKARRVYPGSTEPAVHGIDLEIADGEFMVLVGPSGCGKSTTLRMLAGLEEVDGGRVLIGDRDVTAVAPKDRDIAMVFQSYALYPHMSVADNMGFALKVSRVGKAERRARVEKAAAMLGLTDYLDRKPRALSGGQRQRVAMGRAIVRSPQVFCMDEPLSNLDAKMRVQTRADIARVQAELGTTTVYVTHDQVEAMTMGDRVAVMKDGVLQQVDTPLALYRDPANLFVAGFIGSPQMNLVDAEVDGDRARVGEGVGAYAVPLAPAVTAQVTGAVTLGVRPEAWRLLGAGDTADGLEAEVLVVEELGADSYVHVRRAGSGIDTLPLVVRTDPRALPGGGAVRGQTVHVAVDPADVYVFDTATGARLRA
ncbi:sn-glycerol-3-phosphate ABC transporter ATP-binding protein UgpC [uncultured Nocardioides sp.]|uniref:ABC transporter ATP-binding protein n=1 Tax=uncultured Nocardioides sp. TaxID=198441 RepID=UPI00260D1830|nr:sn-glycerol-3-phosphate ABC transporter ATP-binding protein UgpC [uncultured Nocardioides sp.]